MRISSLRYMKSKRLDNDIKAKTISKNCTNYQTKEEPRKKSATVRYRTRMHKTNSVCTERNSPTPNPLGHNADIPERYNLCSTSEPGNLVASKEREFFLNNKNMPS